MKFKFSTRCLFAATVIAAIPLGIDQYMETKVGKLDTDFKSVLVREPASDLIAPEGWSIARTSIRDTTSIRDRLCLCRRVTVCYHHTTAVAKTRYGTSIHVVSDVRTSPLGYRVIKRSQSPILTMY